MEMANPLLESFGDLFVVCGQISQRHAARRQHNLGKRFFYVCDMKSFYSKLTGAVNSGRFGMPICVWGPCVRLQSLLKTS